MNVEEKIEKNKRSTKKKIIVGIVSGFISILLVIIFIVSGYIIYVASSFYRIQDNQTLDIDRSKIEQIDQIKNVDINKEMKVTTYNIGFGAYDPEYSFFLDIGHEKETNKETVGKYSRAKSKEIVEYNTNSIIDFTMNLNSDFYLFQEVDTQSDRSYYVNQYQEISTKFGSKNYLNVFASNFHSAYLFYPILDPIGKSNSGILTLSEYQIDNSIRKSYTIDMSFPTKFFDLDRCFQVNYLPIQGQEDKYLVLINSHMSAYDEGGTIRNKQANELLSFMESEVDKGNYVICGGDFNHDLLTNNPSFPEYTKDNVPFDFTINPDWLTYLFNDNKESVFTNDSSFKVVADDTAPTVRGTDVGFVQGTTYVGVVDGFLVSNNIEVISIKNHDTQDANSSQFAFSDHQPSTLTFKLI